MKLYFDSLTTLEVIHAESLIVIFFGTYGTLKEIRYRLSRPRCMQYTCIYGNTPMYCAVIFTRVLFSRISRVRTSQKFPHQFVSIYSNKNSSKIAILSHRKFLHPSPKLRKYLRENYGVYTSSPFLRTSK